MLKRRGFINFLCFLLMLLFTTSCANKVIKLDLNTLPPNSTQTNKPAATPENTEKDEIIYDEEYFRKAEGHDLKIRFTLINGFPVDDPDEWEYLFESSAKYPLLFPYDGEGAIKVKFMLTNIYEGPNKMSLLVLCDGIPVKHSIEELEGERYFFETILCKEESLETEVAFIPAFTEEQGRIDFVVISNTSNYDENNLWPLLVYTMYAQCPEGYQFYKPEITFLESFTKREQVSGMKSLSAWFNPSSNQLINQKIRLNNSKKVVFEAVTHYKGPHRTFFLLGFEPILNPDGSVLLIEWEATQDEMVTYNLELNGFPEEGEHCLMAIMTPMAKEHIQEDGHQSNPIVLSSYKYAVSFK